MSSYGDGCPDHATFNPLCAMCNPRLGRKALLRSVHTAPETGARQAFEVDYVRDTFVKPKPPACLTALDLAELAKTRAEPVKFAIDGLAPLAEVTLFTGPGSGGKSLLAQQLCTAAASGKPTLGLSIIAAPSLYVTCEDAPSQLHYRQERLCEAMGVSMASLAGRLHLVSLRGALDNPLEGEDEHGDYAPSPAFHRLAETIKATGSKIVALDNVAHLFTGNENDRGDVTRYVNLLNRLAGETGAAILLIGHPNKSGDTYSGSTAWLNAVRSQVWIDTPRDSDGNPSDPDARVLTVGKANYARAGEAVRFRWHNWAFVRDEDLPADTRAELDKVIRANSENAAFLACLRARNEQGDGRAVGPAPGPNYAPTQFEGMPQAKGFGKAVLKRAMDRLYEIGQIESGTIFDKKARRDKTIIVEVEGDAPQPAQRSAQLSHNTAAHHATTRSTTIAQTHSIPKGISGAPHEADAPVIDDDDDGCPRCGGAGCAWCE